MRLMPLFIMLMLLFVSGCPGPAEELPQTKENATRSYYIGLVPSPKNQPETSFEDIVAAYEEAGRLGEVMMVWSDPNCIGQCSRLRQTRVVEAARSNGMEPVLTLNFATIHNSSGKGLQYGVCWPNHTAANITDPEFRKAWINEAKSLAAEFRPSYFSLGNEVNDYFYLHPEDLPHYITLYDEAYAEIKKVSPETKVFVVFSYTHLIDNSQWGMLEKFDNRSDLIGLTTYPWKHYSSPQEIPSGYYRRAGNYTTKPIAFTEIGWPSTGSEYEQAEFLAVFQNRTGGMDLEMVNWLFLHEIPIEGTLANVIQDETATVSLKERNGTKKEIYSKWQELAEKEVRP